MNAIFCTLHRPQVGSFASYEIKYRERPHEMDEDLLEWGISVEVFRTISQLQLSKYGSDIYIFGESCLIDSKNKTSLTDHKIQRLDHHQIYYITISTNNTSWLESPCNYLRAMFAFNSYKSHLYPQFTSENHIVSFPKITLFPFKINGLYPLQTSCFTPILTSRGLFSCSSGLKGSSPQASLLRSSLQSCA